METLVLLVLAGFLMWGAIWCFLSVIKYDIARAKQDKAQRERRKNKQGSYIVVVDGDYESDVDRQNREYGDYYGDSYYF